MNATLQSGLAEVVTICANRFNQNCFLLLQPGTRSCIVIDPGFGYEAIEGELRKRDLTIDCIIATHTHFDHIASVARLQAEFGTPPFLCHPDEQSLLAKANVFALLLKTDPISAPAAWRHMLDGDTLDFGGDTLRAHHAPGHTPGSLVLEYRDLLFCGDLLLNVPAVLRRLPGTDDAQLDASRRRVLAAFPDDTRVLPGHGRPRTILELRQRFHDGKL